MKKFDIICKPSGKESAPPQEPPAEDSSKQGNQPSPLPNTQFALRIQSLRVFFACTTQPRPPEVGRRAGVRESPSGRP